MNKIYFSRESGKYSVFCIDHVAEFKGNVYWRLSFTSIADFMRRKYEEYDEEDHDEMRSAPKGSVWDRWNEYQNNQGLRFETERLLFLEQAIALQYDQNPDLKILLMETGDAKLIYNNKHDSFLGIGEHETGPHAGKNHLGRLLMEYREVRKYE